MQSKAESEEIWEADPALLLPPPEDSGSGLMNTLLNGHKVSALLQEEHLGEKGLEAFRPLGEARVSPDQGSWKVNGPVHPV